MVFSSIKRQQVEEFRFKKLNGPLIKPQIHKNRIASIKSGNYMISCFVAVSYTIGSSNLVQNGM